MTVTATATATATDEACWLCGNPGKRVPSYLVFGCARFGIDLREEYERKMECNRRRP